jgi:hypothetical protein
LIEYSKLFFLKLLILLLLTVKVSYVLSETFSDIPSEQIINTCTDEGEIEPEFETAYFQKITKFSSLIIPKTNPAKAPVFKNTFSHRIHLIEFTTPPPEFFL